LAWPLSDVPYDPAVDELLATGKKELLVYFLDRPWALERLTPRQGEDLVDAVYRNLGFVTERLGRWNQADGGVDILAVSKRTDSDRETRLAIQVKTGASKISAGPIRELAGVLPNFGADSGVVVTTSEFTRPAIEEWVGGIWAISLQDRDELLRKIVSVVLPDIFMGDNPEPTWHRPSTNADHIGSGLLSTNPRDAQNPD
jgi:restriction endonuclease Mrr